MPLKDGGQVVQIFGYERVEGVFGIEEARAVLHEVVDELTQNHLHLHIIPKAYQTLVDLFDGLLLQEDGEVTL